MVDLGWTWQGSRQEREVIVEVERVSFGDAESVLEFDSGKDCTTL